MKAIKEETGFWEPSTGSLYPLLESLEDEGLIKCIDESNGKLWEITPQGEKAFNEADQAKEELFQGMRRSLFVFANVFGEQGMKELFEEIPHWRDNDQERIERKKRYLKIGHIIMHLEEFDQFTRDKITSILEKTLQELNKIDTEVVTHEHDN